MHLGIIGFGNIGRTLADLLKGQPVDRLSLLVRPAAVPGAEDALRASSAAGRVDVFGALEPFRAARPNLVVECAGHTAVSDLVVPLLSSGVPCIVASTGALAKQDIAERLHAAASTGKTQLHLAPGAIGGVDLLSALASSGPVSVTYRGVKPPAAWRGTVAEESVDLDTLVEPALFFSGTAREACQRYPKNANVAATLALAGPGFEATRVELVADPSSKGNAHSFEVVSTVCSYRVDIENTPSGANARTSVATVHSLLREINRYRAPIFV